MHGIIIVTQQPLFFQQPIALTILAKYLGIFDIILILF